MNTVESYTPTERTKVRRRAQRGVYDKATVHSILDEGFLCHLGFVIDGQPYVIPTGYVRAGEQIYIHGSPVSRIMGIAAEGHEICLTVTLVDGFVLARSVFHHSLNYRSVVVLGKPRMVTDPHEKYEALQRFTDHIWAARWDRVRHPTQQELNATTVLSLALDEVSAKVRTGPPLDDEQDYALPVWAGVVPFRTTVGEPVPDSRVLPGVAPPGTRF
jgi:uncharacterized protein